MILLHGIIAGMYTVQYDIIREFVNKKPHGTAPHGKEETWLIHWS